MAFLENNKYSTIKEAIINSTGDYGLIAIYVNPTTKEEVFFLNGKPYLKW
jgi:hypothetical protein